jgi:hypothetical protein
VLAHCAAALTAAPASCVPMRRSGSNGLHVANAASLHAMPWAPIERLAHYSAYVLAAASHAGFVLVAPLCCFFFFFFLFMFLFLCLFSFLFFFFAVFVLFWISSACATRLRI